MSGLADPKQVKVITEKRATFACTPALMHPVGKTSLTNLFLAGDYIAGEYPATLEAAERGWCGEFDCLMICATDQTNYGKR